MNLIELMETWKLADENRQKSNVDFLLEIMERANLDERLERETLALEIINECGTQTPRYMNTGVFITFAVNFFKVREREYARDLDALDIEYAALTDYDITKTRARTTNAINERTRTDDLTETTDTGDTTFTHSVSADNESGFVGRSQDITHDDTPKTRENTGTQTSEESRDFAENATYTENGRKRPAQELLFSEFEANKINMYRNIALDFSDVMMSGIY